MMQNPPLGGAVPRGTGRPARTGEVGLGRGDTQ